MNSATLLLLAAVASAAPSPKSLPMGMDAFPIQSGTVLLLVDGVPDDAPTALAAGWCFTAEGYDRLNTATYNLQVAVEKLDAKAKALEKLPDLQPVPSLTPSPQSGWSGRTVFLIAAGALAAGFLGARLLLPAKAGGSLKQP